MANEKHVKMALKGVGGWNGWRNQKWAIEPDLREVDLSGFSFNNGNFQSVILEKACLIETDLCGANLSKAILRKASLYLANLREASLKQAILYKADLNRACLEGASLEDANLYGVNLEQANLKGADLSGAFLHGANLHKADLSGANLCRAHLSRANLTEADLSGANLQEARLEATTLGGTNLSEVTGLDSCHHDGPSTIDLRALTTLMKSGRPPITFLQSCGFLDSLVDFLSLPFDDASQLPAYFFVPIGQKVIEGEIGKCQVPFISEH